MTIEIAKRPKFHFWLDRNKPEENYLFEVCHRLKSQRKFTQTVRDGIRLIEDLRRGRTDVLVELFPHIVMRLQTSTNYDVQWQLEELKSLLQSPSYVSSPAQPIKNSILETPDSFGFDDLSLEVASTSSNSSGIQNLVDTFLNF